MVIIFDDMLELAVALIFAVSVRADTRILGGEEATIEQLPYQAALEYSDYTTCGGAIVSPTHIVTAAHCVTGEDELQQAYVRVGSAVGGEGGTRHTAKAIEVFPSWVYPGPANDVAVITLTEPIQFGATAQPISLVPVGEEPKHGEMLTVSGWGCTSYICRPPRILHMVKLPSIRREMCAPVLLEDLKEVVTKNMICAGGGVKRASFKGDSGGPLVNSKKQLVGIVSWGRPYNTTGYPRVFTNVASPEISEFIRSRMQ